MVALRVTVGVGDEVGVGMGVTRATIVEVFVFVLKGTYTWRSEGGQHGPSVQVTAQPTSVE